MLGILLSVVIFAFLGLILPIIGLNKNSYGTELEKYISSRNPSNVYEVEQYAKEFESKRSQRFL